MMPVESAEQLLQNAELPDRSAELPAPAAEYLSREASRILCKWPFVVFLVPL
jgi:hypothetical protein